MRCMSASDRSLQPAYAPAVDTPPRAQVRVINHILCGFVERRYWLAHVRVAKGATPPLRCRTGAAAFGAGFFLLEEGEEPHSSAPSSAPSSPHSSHSSFCTRVKHKAQGSHASFLSALGPPRCATAQRRARTAETSAAFALWRDRLVPTLNTTTINITVGRRGVLAFLLLVRAELLVRELLVRELRTLEPPSGSLHCASRRESHADGLGSERRSLQSARACARRRREYEARGFERRTERPAASVAIFSL